MGAWGVVPFDNDDAADWAAEFDGLDRSAGLRLLDSAFAAANVDHYIEAPEGSIAVAAAQVAAWLVTPRDVTSSSYSSSAAAWVERAGGSPDDAMIDAARRALRRVRSDSSELADLWGEAGDDEWRLELQRIDGLLGGTDA